MRSSGERSGPAATPMAPTTCRPCSPGIHTTHRVAPMREANASTTKRIGSGAGVLTL